MFGLLDLVSQHLGKSALALVAAGYAAWKYRRLKAWGALIVGGVSTVTFAGVVVVFAALGGVAAGWLTPGEVVSDLAGWGSDAWDVVAQPAIDLVTEVIR